MVDFNKKLKEYQEVARKGKKAAIAPPPEPEEVHELMELGLPKRDLEKLAPMVELHGQLGAEKRALEKERKALTPKIKDILGQYGIGKAFCGEWRIGYHNAPRTTLSAILLLEHGVSPQVISACTVTKDVYTLRITPRSEPEPKGFGEEE